MVGAARTPAVAESRQCTERTKHPEQAKYLEHRKHPECTTYPEHAQHPERRQAAYPPQRGPGRCRRPLARRSAIPGG